VLLGMQASVDRMLAEFDSIWEGLVPREQARVATRSGLRQVYQKHSSDGHS
jgi:hypothetical protein